VQYRVQGCPKLVIKVFLAHLHTREKGILA
jgi:hypothetical protein